MRLFTTPIAAIIVVLLSPASLLAQSSQSADSSQTVSVPRLINISGVFRPADGQPPARVETVTVAIYAEETGGSPLWQETQSVAVDASGRYTVQLGATGRDGIPVDVFASGAARWLGVAWSRVGEIEGPRVRITSVPYALRASDADTLGGRPASDYVVAGTSDVRAAGTTSNQSSVATPDTVLPGSTNFLAKYVNGTDVGNSAVYETGGFVGVGTTTPADLLHVRFTNPGGNLTGLAVQNLGNTATSYSGMLFYDQNGALGQFQGFNNSSHEYRINNIASNGSINFMLGGQSRFRVASNGRIGIGTMSPAAQLDVASDFNSGIYVTNAYNGGYFNGRTSRGTVAVPENTGLGDWLAVFGGYGYGDSGYFQGGYINFYASEAWTDAARGTDILFATTAPGENSTQYRFTIRGGGNVGIGTTFPADKLQVTGDIRVGTGGTNGCVKNYSGAGIVGVCASDQRFKKDVTPFGHTLERLTALQPVHYSWRASEFPERHFGESRAYGLIAQQVEQVLPELVVMEADGYKAVDYGKLPLLTIQAIKELKAENDTLKTRVTELERLVKQLLAVSDKPR